MQSQSKLIYQFYNVSPFLPSLSLSITQLNASLTAGTHTHSHTHPHAHTCWQPTCLWAGTRPPWLSCSCYTMRNSFWISPKCWTYRPTTWRASCTASSHRICWSSHSPHRRRCPPWGCLPPWVCAMPLSLWRACWATWSPALSSHGTTLCTLQPTSIYSTWPFRIWYCSARVGAKGKERLKSLINYSLLRRHATGSVQPLAAGQLSLLRWHLHPGERALRDRSQRDCADYHVVHCGTLHRHLSSLQVSGCRAAEQLIDVSPSLSPSPPSTRAGSTQCRSCRVPSSSSLPFGLPPCCSLCRRLFSSPLSTRAQVHHVR